MKLNPNYVLRQIAGQTILVSLRDANAPKKILCLNELATAIYHLLADELNETQIVAALLDEYDVNESTLRADVSEFLSVLSEHRVISD